MTITFSQYLDMVFEHHIVSLAYDLEYEPCGRAWLRKKGTSSDRQSLVNITKQRLFAEKGECDWSDDI